MMDKSKKILVIDPDAGIREEYLSLFNGEDYELEISAGFTKAMEKIKNVHFDCIIIDTHLPEILVYDAVPIIKTIYPEVEVIVTTAKNSRELETKVREQDIFYYYIKSFEMEELRLAVSDIFKKLGKIKEVKKMKQPPLILIVDNDPDFVKETRTILKTKSYKVEIAYDRNEAMEKIKHLKPDLILLDIMMKEIDDGFTICYDLKHDPELKNIPVFAISGITEKTGFKFSPKTDGEYFAADDYVEKPIEADDLLKRIEALLTK